jgi:hypothetical protein
MSYKTTTTNGSFTPSILAIGSLLAALLSFASESALAADFTVLLAGDAAKLAIKLKDFDQSWRCVNIHGTSSISGNTSVNVSGNPENSVSQNNNLIGTPGGSRLYVTKGQVVSVSDQIFLVAYHLPSGGLDLGVLLQAAATKAPPKTDVLTPETPLRLCYLNLRSISGLEGVREFDMAQEIAASEKAAKALETMFKQQEASAKPSGQPANQPKPEANK